MIRGDDCGGSGMGMRMFIHCIHTYRTWIDEGKICIWSIGAKWMTGWDGGNYGKR